MAKINIDPTEVINQYYAEQQKLVEATKKKTVFDAKNYLNARLAPNEQTKQLTIRLLPFTAEEGTPFHKVMTHTVKVNKEIAPSGWKIFVCPTQNKLGTECPFCKVSSEARKMRFESEDEITKKKLGEVEFANKAKECWLVRCIERGHEEDGPKFWLFSHSKRADGVLDKIMNLFETRKNAAAKRGINYNIFDLYEGQDLIVTLSRTSDGKTTVQVVDEGIQSPLSTSEEQVLAWVNDEKKWTDVYTVKSTDYMEIVCGGGIPVYNKELQKFVNKLDQQEEKDKETANLDTPSKDYTSVQTTNTAKEISGENDLPF